MRLSQLILNFARVLRLPKDRTFGYSCLATFNEASAYTCSNSAMTSARVLVDTKPAARITYSCAVTVPLATGSEKGNNKKFSLHFNASVNKGRPNLSDNAVFTSPWRLVPAIWHQQAFVVADIAFGAQRALDMEH